MKNTHLKLTALALLALCTIPAGGQNFDDLPTITGAEIDLANDKLSVRDASVSAAAGALRQMTLAEYWKALGGTNVSTTELSYIGGLTSDAQTQINAKEASLGNPGTNGHVLSSTTGGTRSWVAPGGTWGSITGTIGSQTDLTTALDGKLTVLGVSATRAAANNLINERFDSEWTYSSGATTPAANNLKSRSVQYEYDATHGWLDLLNPANDAVSPGICGYCFVAPVTGTATFRLVAKTGPGQANTNINFALEPNATVGAGLNVSAIAITSTLTEFSRTLSVTAGTQYMVYVSDLVSKKILIGGVRVTIPGMTGILASDFVRVSVRPEDIYSGSMTFQNPRYLKTTVGARVGFWTSATSVIVETSGDIYASFPLNSKVGVLVNGQVYTEISHGDTSELKLTTVTLPAGMKFVECVSSLRSRPGSVILGVAVRAIYFPAASITRMAKRDHSRRIAVFGDSISAGGNADAGGTAMNGAWEIIGRSGHAEIHNDSWGFRMLASGTTGLVESMVRFNPTDVYLAIGFNDYWLSGQSAAAFGTAYAALLDAIHAALPGARIWAQTPLSASTETDRGGGLGTLPDYRSQITTVVAARSWATLLVGTSMIATGDLADGIHPDKVGHAKYSWKITEALGFN